MSSTLDQLKSSGTLIVADSGDISKLAALGAQDATTNPSLIFAAAQKPEYSALLDEACAYAKAQVPAAGEAQMALAMDKLAVLFGVAISKLVPGYVSTEVDARLSFDAPASTERARRIIALYQQAGVDTGRVLIKLAATWEGIRAAEVLQKEGIHCNLTLLFSFEQAVACAEAGVTLISPFVGRIYDWHKAKNGGADIPAAADPGVHSVRKIYAYFRKHAIPTIVMGASFRSVEQIVALAGCDRLTIGPALLDKMAAMQLPAPAVLTPAMAAAEPGVPDAPLHMTEAGFRFSLNEDAMAADKLAEGIRGFSADLRKLEALLAPRLL